MEGCDKQKPTVIWMRPPELGVEGPGISIISGPVYGVMLHLSSYLESYNHQFEAYPVKRAWSLIQHEKSPQHLAGMISYIGELRQCDHDLSIQISHVI